MFNIKEELKKLPDKPGCYIMRDKNNIILYVGKAISLKSRVRQYFQKNNKTARIEKMVSLIDHFEYIVTDSESEALILECNLIKENMPKFNVLLKDDKTYPYIKVTINEDYPSIIYTRKIFNDGAKYFGPYADAKSAKEMVDFIKRKFKIRQCRSFKSNKRACLNYHIGRCSAPCARKISKEDYRDIINKAIMLLEGKINKVVKEIDENIKMASEKLDFEEAAYLRDQKLAILAISEKQKVSNISENNIDVIGIARNEMMVCLEIFFVRGSKMIGREHYFFDEIKDMDDGEIISGFIKQYYFDLESLPNRIMIKEEIEDREIIEEYLSEKAKRKVEIKTPKIGGKLRFVEMAEKNAEITLNNKSDDKFEILTELKEKCNLDVLPRKIESFDISNISGTNIVAGMAVLSDGVVKRNLSRRFKIKTVFGQDDPRCMGEVVERRVNQSIKNPKGGFGELPNLILADGGITQINAIKESLIKCNVTIPVFGMVKDDKHKTRALIDDNRQEIDISEKLNILISNFQEEVHNVAIEYHRKQREKEMVKSELDDIPGVGETKRIELLKYFGDVNKIRKSSVEELTKVKGINESLAKVILENL